MDQPIYLLFGAGALIMIVAFFLRSSRAAADTAPMPGLPAAWPSVEVEQTLKRFLQQVKQDNEQEMARLRETKAELLRELDELRKRVEATEVRLTQLAGQLESSGSASADEANRSAADADTLLLRERYRRVFEWNQEGMSVEEIAKRLGAGRGEIELILSLAAPADRRKTDE